MAARSAIESLAVYVTRNTEYHVRARRCVRVRDRASGRFLTAHGALDRPLGGGLKFRRDGAPAEGSRHPTVGDSLLFCADDRDVVTSPVLHICIDFDVER